MKSPTTFVRAIALMLAAILSCLACPGALAQCEGRWLASPPPTPPAINGQVLALAALPNGDIVAGGSFTSAGGAPDTRYIARWDGSSWTPLGSGVNNAVYALAVLPSGDLVAGGFFTSAGGVPGTSRIARWDGSSWSPLGSGTNGGVLSLAVLPSGDLVAGGTVGFTNAGGVTVNSIARWNGASWAPLASGMNGSVRALAVLPSGDLVAGGTFTTAGSVTVNRIARWNGASWAPLGPGMNDSVYALAVLPSGDLVAGGYFATAGGVTTNGIARWNGSSWAPLGAGMGGPVFALAVLSNGDLVVGGGFTTAGSVAANRIARWNGSSWSPLGAGLSDLTQFPAFGNALTVTSGGALVVGGQFAFADGLPARNIAAWDGSSWSPIVEPRPAGGLQGGVFGVAPLSDGQFVVVGPDTADGLAVSGAARWTGSQWEPLGSGLASNDFVAANAAATLPNGSVVVAGHFTTAGGVPARNIAAWNGAQWAPLGSGLGTFDPNGFSIVNTVKALPDGRVLAGGLFETAGGAAASGVAVWDGASWMPLGAGLAYTQGPPQAFAFATLPNGDVIVGGQFTSAGSVAASNIARWDGATWSPLGAGIGSAFSAVTALSLLPNGDLIAGGFFTQAGGVAANNIARWNGSSWSSLGSGLDSDVFALALLPSGDLIAGGSFGSAGGSSANRIARWNGAAWSPLGSGLNGSPFADCYALALLPNGELVAGGFFDNAGGEPTRGWARWVDVPSPRIAAQPTPRAVQVGGSAYFTVTIPAGYDFNGPVTYQWRRNGQTLADGPTAFSGVVSGATTRSVYLTNLSTLNSGRYSVVISNSCGSVTSTGVLLTVGSSACPGDANGDGSITFADLNAVLSAFGQSITPPGNGGDVNGDGAVTFADLNTVLSAFGSGC